MASTAAASASAAQALRSMAPPHRPELLSLDLPRYDPSRSRTVDLAIVGGGPAGLAVVQRVAEAGFSVVSIDPRRITCFCDRPVGDELRPGLTWRRPMRRLGVEDDREEETTRTRGRRRPAVEELEEVGRQGPRKSAVAARGRREPAMVARKKRSRGSDPGLVCLRLLAEQREGKKRSRRQ